MEQQPADIYSWILFVIKIAAFISTGIFGVLGTIRDSKDKKGNVTRWGRIAVAGVIISGLISASTLFAEEAVKNAEKQKTDAKNLAAQQALNLKFEELVTKASENIGKTDEVLIKTKGVAEEVQRSVGVQEEIVKTQAGVIEKTNNISENVKKNIEGQNQVLIRTEKIGNSLSVSAVQQQKLLYGNNELLSGMKTQLDFASNILVSQNELSKNSLRLLAPLKTMGIAYTIRLNVEEKEFTKYIDQLVELAKKEKPKIYLSAGSTYYIPQGMNVYMNNNEITGFTLDDGSSLFPSIENNDDASLVSIFENLSSSFVFSLNRNQTSLKDIAYKTFHRTSDIVFAPSIRAKKTLRVNFDESGRNVYFSVFAPDLGWTPNNRNFLGFIDLFDGTISVLFPQYKNNPTTDDSIDFVKDKEKTPSLELKQIVLLTDFDGIKYCLSPDVKNHKVLEFFYDKVKIYENLFIYKMTDLDFKKSPCYFKVIQ